MGDFEPNAGPGKTAPRLLGDLLEYDARRAPTNRANLLVDPAPIYLEEQSSLYPLRQLPSDCTHCLWRKDTQTIVPPIDQSPDTTSQYISASYCDRCFQHFDVIADYTKRPGRSIPCREDLGFPLHHFLHVKSHRKSIPERKAHPDKYDNHFESHIFVCSAPDCPLVLEIRISPPRLNKERLSLLIDQAKVFKRGQKAIKENPDRYDENAQPAVPNEVLALLQKYLSDALAAKDPAQMKKIAVRNKRFLMLFGSDCDELLQYLEFVPYSEYNTATLEMDQFWKIPVVSSQGVDAPFGTKSLSHLLTDVIMELSQRIVETQHQIPSTQQIFSPLPALKDVQKVLGCLDYPKVNRVIDVDATVHPHYLGLGAAGDFSDSLLIFAYGRQRDVDPKNKPYYLECLHGISMGRNSADLDEEYVKAVSMGEYRYSDIEAAYKFFNISPDAGEDLIIGTYKSRIESAPRQKDEAKQQLLIIGQSRNSDRIHAVANDKTMTYMEALEYLSITADTPVDFIEAAAASMAAEGDASQVSQALKVIGTERNDFALDMLIQKFESGDASGLLDVAEAYRRLQIPDRTSPDELVITYYQSLIANAPAGSKASYTEALRTIASSRNSSILKAQADNPDGPIPVEKGTEDQPVGLDNIGNTCYLNSLLQYYYTVKAVRDVVMNFQDYRMELNTENMLKKRVGGRAVTRGEIIKAQHFVEELQNLFTNLKQAPTRSVKPTQDLAELTLFSSATEANFRRASINSPGQMPNIGSFMDHPVFGPELPPPPPTRPSPTPNVSADDVEMVDRPSNETTEHDDGSSDATLVDLDTHQPEYVALDKSIVMTDLSSEDNEPGEPTVDTNVHEPEYLIVSTDKDKIAQPNTKGTAVLEPEEQQTNGKITNGSVVDSPVSKDSSSPDRPPPVPPRNKPAPIKISGDSEEVARKEKLSFGAQQDVTEVIGNVMFRLQCAIKPTSIDPKFGEQIDKIRETFYGANAVSLKKAATYDVKVEDWANLIVFPSEEGSRDIYEALDVVFDEQLVEIDNALTTQYASISKLPPVFQIQIQRTAFNSRTQQASKNTNSILFDETIYLDRYMDSERVMSRRRDAWKWKTKLRKLEARQKVLQNNVAGITVPDALNATKDYLRMLQEEEVDGVLVDGPLTESLSERAADLTSELETIASEVVGLKQKLQDQFMDMREHRYRLQSVFIHRGSSSYGHYWIYIYDFERDVWREYNDDRVSEVRDRKQVFEQSGGATPYYLVYVRDEDKDDLVDAVCRDIIEEPDDETADAAFNLVDEQPTNGWDAISGLEMDKKSVSADHVEYASLGASVEQDVSGVGAWDPAAQAEANRKW